MNYVLYGKYHQHVLVYLSINSKSADYTKCFGFFFTSFSVYNIDKYDFIITAVFLSSLFNCDIPS